MLSVCLIFLYVLLSAYLLGFLTLQGIRHIFGNCKVRADGYIMAGLTAATVYAQIFSLFYKVGLTANLLLAAICATTAFVFRGQLKEELLQQCRAVSKSRKIVYILLFLLMAYGTSRGVIHYDTSLYHAQSIRWIEEYGLVKGLGNLHCRLAYNSSSFALSALYSFRFLGGQSYHCMAGVFALILAGSCSEIVSPLRKKGLFLSDFARLMGIYYLLIIFDEMVSPASDYFMVLTVFYIIIRYLELSETGEQNWLPYGLLALLCVFTVSIKLSAALIILLAAKPAIMLIQAKNGKAIAGFLGLGSLILLPCLLRNMFISGWLVYPFTAIDLFPMDWKIPKEIADYDAKEIQVWGRGLYDVAAYAMRPAEWMPKWFAGQGAADKLFILAGIAAVPISLAALGTACIKKNQVQRDLMLAAATINISFLFWLFSAPLIRYGCVYVWLAAPVTFGGLSLWAIGKEGTGKLFWRLVYGGILLIGCYKTIMFATEAVKGFSADYFIYQKDYENFEVQSYEINGVTFYYPKEGDRIGYEAFPSSPAMTDLEFRGNGIEDGFRYKNGKE